MQMIWHEAIRVDSEAFFLCLLIQELQVFSNQAGVLEPGNSILGAGSEEVRLLADIAPSRQANILPSESHRIFFGGAALEGGTYL
jgi:hypothetical protein